MMTRLSYLFVKIFILLNIIVLAMFFVGWKQANKPPVNQKSLKILAIGNSFTNRAIDYLPQLVNESGDSIVVACALIGSSSLETHWNNLQTNADAYYLRFVYEDTIVLYKNKSLTYCIEYLDWDYVILQQLSTSSGIYNSYFPYITDLIDCIYDHASNKDVEIGFHQTWAYNQTSTREGFANYDNDQLVMYDSIRYVSERICQELNIKTFIPAGTAIQNARETLGDAFCYDGYHLNDLGRYVVACAWFETFFGKNCLNVKTVPTASVSDDTLYVLRSAVHNACISPHSVTK